MGRFNTSQRWIDKPERTQTPENTWSASSCQLAIIAKQAEDSDVTLMVGAAGDSIVDLSPCDTGTCTEAARRHARGTEIFNDISGDYDD